ncbi:bifunctional oligoribonuclease and PAP phosphatase NrnA [Peptococcaceae bacterium CEB3]|nr:bifunctional oligoribonuclease and PAP phosphatase NrnA [Peptococcaceae bacterium CEB3]
MIPMKSEEMPRLVNELRKAPKVALFSHVSPDGDCIGSMLALGLALESLGKEVEFYNPDPLPHNLTFLPGATRIRRAPPGKTAPVLLLVDCADLARAGLKPDRLPENTLLLSLDHHISNRHFAGVNVVDPEAAATGELAYQVVLELGVSMERDIAINLYTALVTDTGSFQYGNTSVRTHLIAAKLLQTGLDLTYIHHQVFDQKPLAQVRLLQRALASLELGYEGKFVLMTLTREDFAACGAEDSLSEGLVNQARSIQGVEVAVLIREVEPGKVKLGLRSNLWLDVNDIAVRFGGGGHKRAAGCSMNLSVAEAKRRITDAVGEALQLGRSD